MKLGVTWTTMTMKWKAPLKPLNFHQTLELVLLQSIIWTFTRLVPPINASFGTTTFSVSGLDVLNKWQISWLHTVGHFKSHFKILFLWRTNYLLGYLVLIPDYYRGVSFDPNSNARHITLQFLTDQSKWANNGQLYQDYSIIKSYAKDNLGCKTFGTIGTCWGTYAVLRMSEDVDIKAAVSMHPSHPSVLGLHFKLW